MDRELEHEERWEDGTLLLSRREFARWLREQVGKRAAGAVVRFGDGEGQLLAIDADDPRSIDIGARKLELETGRKFSLAEMLDVKALLARAFDEGDVLGIRTGESYSDVSKMWMNRLTALYVERVAAGRSPAMLANSLLNHYMLDKLPALLAGRRASVISCRDVRSTLEVEWSVIDVRAYQVPSQHAVRYVDGTYEAAIQDVPIWPDAHARVRSELEIREEGEIFLVGAGPFGKDLCIDVRERGGFALDMGSALDRVAGKVTRGPKRRVHDLLVRGKSVDEIVTDLQRAYGVPVARDRVVKAVWEIRDAYGVSTAPPNNDLPENRPLEM